MKSQRILATLTIGALAIAGLSQASAQNNGKPTVLTPPAVKDGSNFSRAPFPAQRQFDDTKAPDGVAVDKELPPNSPATNIEPPIEPARVAVLQPATTAPVAVATTTTVVDPVLTPTGRSTVVVATGLDAATFSPTIRAATHENRDQIITDIESRVTTTDKAIENVRGTMSAMSADGRKAYGTVEDTVKQKAKALKKSLQAARKASASEWENARAQLAADYDAYAASVAQIDATTR